MIISLFGHVWDRADSMVSQNHCSALYKGIRIETSLDIVFVTI